MSEKSAIDPFVEPGMASVEDGHVVLDGPDGIAITLTAEAAIATGASLVDAGEKALEQRQKPGNTL